MVEKSRVERSGVEMSGVEMSSFKCMGLKSPGLKRPSTIQTRVEKRLHLNFGIFSKKWTFDTI